MFLPALSLHCRSRAAGDAGCSSLTISLPMSSKQAERCLRVAVLAADLFLLASYVCSQPCKGVHHLGTLCSCFHNATD